MLYICQNKICRQIENQLRQFDIEFLNDLRIFVIIIDDL